MKRILKNKFLILLALSGVLMSSCSEDNTETIFDQTPTERVNAKVSELRELLLSQPNGYKAVYFTKNDERGGFTTFMQFNADGTVRQTSDFDDDSALANSSYEVRLGTTIELVFTTRNHITKGTDPTAVTEVINGFPTGLGFFGTSVFQYFSNDNGTITFRDNRNSETALMVLTPTNFSDFDTDSLEAVNALRGQIENISVPSGVLTPTNHVLEIKNDNGVERYQFSYNGTRRFSNAIGFSEVEIVELSFGIAYTEEGITISPALEVGGESYIDFLYDEATNSFISEVNGTSATILYDSAPAFINPNDIAELEELGPTGFLFRRSLGANPLTSGNHDALLNQVTVGVQAIIGAEWSVGGYQLITDFESDDCATVLVLELSNINGGGANVSYCFDRAVIADGNLFLNYQGPDGFEFLEPAVLPLINFLADPNGLEFTRQGSFTSDTRNFSNLSGTFRNLSEPSIRVYGLFFG